MAKKPDKVVRSWVPQRVSFEREKDNSAFYNSWPWRKLRKAFRIKNPLCVYCEANDIVTPGKVVDHIIPINKGGGPLDINNLQSLCEKCHNSKSSRESRGMG